MTAGNIFRIIINDGVQSRLLHAHEMLLDRINELKIDKINACNDKIEAYFSDVEREQKDSKYANEKVLWEEDKYQYCADRVQLSMSDLRKTHNIYVNSVYKPFISMAYTYLKATDSKGLRNFDSEVTFDINNCAGHWISDMVAHIQLTGLSTKSSLDKIKYADLLGHRLFERVEFRVNDRVISAYGTEDMNVYYQFDVSSEKRPGWLRNIGQEVLSQGFLTQEPKVDEYREYKWYGDGPQTLKQSHDVVDMWIPLIFWFNKDLAQAFPNKKIPYGSIKVAFKIRGIDELVAVANYGGGGAYNTPSIATFDLFVNQIVTIPEVANIMMKKYYDFNMIRINKQFEATLNQPNGDILLKDLKFPIENIAIGIRPVENLSNVDIWHRNKKLTKINVKTPVVIQNPVANSIAISNAYYFSEEDSITEAALKLQDNKLFKSNPIKLYTSYIPYTFKGYNTPIDGGWMIFNFQFRKDQYDPSGHLDMSKNRELYFHYESAVITNEDRAKMYVIASAINFLLIKENDAILRYSL
jgi:hypothetical protein